MALGASTAGDAFKGLFLWLAENGMVDTFKSGLPKVTGMPVEILWFVAITAVATYLLLRSPAGNWIFASCGDRDAASNSGVPVNRVKISLFMLTACCAALVAIITVLDAGSTKGRGLMKRFDVDTANEITMAEMRKMGIHLRAPDQAVGTLSGGERQTAAIAQAVYFGAKVLILDEPTSALGLRQTSNVLATIDRVRKQGIGVVFIRHNVRHALAVGDRFTVLNRGKTLGTAKQWSVGLACGLVARRNCLAPGRPPQQFGILVGGDSIQSWPGG